MRATGVKPEDLALNPDCLCDPGLVCDLILLNLCFLVGQTVMKRLGLFRSSDFCKAQVGYKKVLVNPEALQA